jgi:hypothetical protein
MYETAQTNNVHEQQKWRKELLPSSGMISEPFCG